MKQYSIIRARNIRVHERVVLPFPSDEEAMAAADDAHMRWSIIGYDGKAHEFKEVSETTPAGNDVSFNIAEVLGPKDWRPITADYESLRPGYVYLNDLIGVCEELDGLDMDWPADRRNIRSCLYRIQEMTKALRAQGAREDQEDAEK